MEVSQELGRRHEKCHMVQSSSGRMCPKCVRGPVEGAGVCKISDGVHRDVSWVGKAEQGCRTDAVRLTSHAELTQLRLCRGT